MRKLISAIIFWWAFCVPPSIAANDDFFSLLDDALADKIDSGTYQPLNILADSDFTMNNKPAFSIYFGKSTNDFFDFTAQCSIFDKTSSKISTRDNKKIAPELSLGYHNQAQNQYMISESKFDTYAAMDVIIDKTQKTITFIVEGKVYDISSDRTYQVNPQKIILSIDEMKKIRNRCK